MNAADHVRAVSRSTIAALCRSAKAGGLEVSLGDIVATTPCDEDSADEAPAQLCMIQALWQTPKAKMMQVMDYPHPFADLHLCAASLLYTANGAWLTVQHC